ncbi:MAG: hypothetical protein K0S33_202 [Bacteroidetes bacterium]|jgi:uncharacterized protein (TIGR02757 family)|nr:hypothetical protein [Bacteroidota bacterium]
MPKLRIENIKEFLDEKVLLYNNRNFIETDPIQIPHLFSKKEDIEIAGFLTATIAWGQRKSIIANSRKLVELMDMDPHSFVLHASKKELLPFKNFVHRTFNGEDCVFFLQSLQHLYKKHGSLEKAFTSGLTKKEADSYTTIGRFREEFFSISHPGRTQKHVSNPLSGSSAKRLCMYQRWMVRKDKNGVDFGIWDSMSPAGLYLPLDVHTGNISRKLQLLERKQNDWKAVAEVTEVLRNLDPKDPVKYDFALFGLGAFEKF